MIADDRIAGIAELMNYPGVFLGHDSELAKIRGGQRTKSSTVMRPGCAGRI